MSFFNDMKLTKIIPTHTKTLTANWCIEYGLMDEKFANARHGKRDPMNVCYWCKTPFKIGDTIHLTQFKEVKPNKVLCTQCATELKYD